MGYKVKRITTWREKTITPRELSANTLFYYKFEWDLVNEVTWTADCSFSWTWSYDTVDWVECVNLNNTWLTLSAKLPANDFTLCWYGNFISFAPDTFNGIIWILGTGNSWLHCQLIDDQYSSIWPSLNMYNYATNQWTAVAISDGYTTWQRYCYTLVRSSGVCTLYVNGVSQASITTWWSNSQSVQYYLWEVYNNTRYYHGYMSKAIMENVAWSASDVQAYFNDTREEYGYPAPGPILEELVIYSKKATAHYYIDLQGTSASGIAEQWWTVSGSPTYYNDGIGSGWVTHPIDVTTAKKITITMECYVYSGSWSNGCHAWITGWDNSMLMEARWETDSGYRWMYIWIGSLGEVVRTNQYVISWDTTAIFELDFTTWVITATGINNGNTQIGVYTLSSALQSEARTNNQMFCSIPSGTQHRIKTLDVVIEY